MSTEIAEIKFRLPRLWLTKTQVALEATLSLVVVFILLAASAKIFVWFGDSLVGRQKAFEATRSILRNVKGEISGVAHCEWEYTPWGDRWNCSGGGLGAEEVQVKHSQITCNEREGCERKVMRRIVGGTWEYDYFNCVVTGIQTAPTSVFDIKGLDYSPPPLNLVKD